MPEATRVVMVNGKEHVEGPCQVPGCTYLYQRPKGSFLKLCALHLRRYKARQGAVRVRRHVAKLRAQRAAEVKRKTLATLG